MKSLFKSTILFFAILSVSAAVIISCKESLPEPAEPASVSVKVLKTTMSSIVFGITPKNAVTFSYAFAKSTEVANVEFVDTEGSEYIEVEMQNLEPSTEYVIIANATNIDGVTSENVQERVITTDKASITIEILDSKIKTVQFKIKPVNAVSYKYTVAESSSAETVELVNMVENGEECTYSLDNLNPDTRYAVVAEAVNSSGDISERAYGPFVTDKNPEILLDTIITDVNAGFVRVSTSDVKEMYYAVVKKGETPAEYVKVKEIKDTMEFYIYDLDMATDYTFSAYGLNLNGLQGDLLEADFTTGSNENADYSLMFSNVTSFDLNFVFNWNTDIYGSAYFVVGEPEQLDPNTYDFEANIYNMFMINSPDSLNSRDYGQFLPGKKYRIGVIFNDLEGNMVHEAVIWKEFQLKDMSFGDSDAKVEIVPTIVSYSTIGYKVLNKGNAEAYYYDRWTTKDLPYDDITDVAKVILSRPWCKYSEFDVETIYTHQSAETSYTFIAIPVDAEGRYGEIFTIEITTKPITTDGIGDYEVDFAEASYTNFQFDVKIGDNTNEVVYVKFKEGDNGYDTEENIIKKLAYSYNNINNDGRLMIDYLSVDTEYNIWFASMDKNYKLGNIVKFKQRTMKPVFDGTGSVDVSVENFVKIDWGYKAKIKFSPDANVEKYYYRLLDESTLENMTDEKFVEQFLAGTSYTVYTGEYIAEGWDGEGEYLSNKYYVVVLPIDKSNKLCPLIKYKIEDTFE